MFGSSLSSVMLTWTLEVSSSGSWMNSYVPILFLIAFPINAIRSRPWPAVGELLAGLDSGEGRAGCNTLVLILTLISCLIAS